MAYTGGECGWCWDKIAFDTCRNLGRGWPLEELQTQYTHDLYLRGKTDGYWNEVWMIPDTAGVGEGYVFTARPTGGGYSHNMGGETFPEPYTWKFIRPDFGQPDYKGIAYKMRPGGVAPCTTNSCAVNATTWTVLEPVGRIHVKALGSTTTEPDPWPPVAPLARPPRGPRVFPQKSQQTSARRGPGSYY